MVNNTNQINNGIEMSNEPNENKKSKNKVIIITILILFAIVGIFIIVLIFGSKNDGKSNGIFSKLGNGKTSVISSKTIDNYNLEISSIWINRALNITYNIPKRISSSPFNGSSSFSYIHGNSFEYYSNFRIYVETSLDGHTNLETLASDIIKEKHSDKYKDVYSFGSNVSSFENDKIEKVKIGDIDTIYFESKTLESDGYAIENRTVSSENIKSKMVGYSFKYNGKYISVYGELPLNENCDIENLKQILQVIINSVKVYNGESLQELGGNAIEFYDGGFSNNDIAINYYSAHNLNGVLAPYYKKVVIELSASKFDYYKDWDKTLDGIIKVADKLKSYDSYFGYSEKTKLKEDEITINKIKMKHYVFKIMYGTNYGAYVSTYTFIVNDTPFILAYGLSDKIDMTSITEEKTQKIIEQTEIVTRSFVDTIRFLNGDSFTKYVKVN